ncbi:MAG TPA: helix-turn-helix domain-containing protein [Pyrinomonadaceae bacterium]|nr:helix-turn-helix domain-containing protein [Pyrinomonadaceae bacterium]
MPYESSPPRPSHQKAQVISAGSGSNFVLQESEVADLVLAETRLEALRSLALVFLREVNALKKILGQKRTRKSDDPIDLEKEMAAIEMGMIKWALMKTGGNQAAAAKLLSINPTTLHAKMKRYRIKATDRFLAVD